MVLKCAAGGGIINPIEHISHSATEMTSIQQMTGWWADNSVGEKYDTQTYTKNLIHFLKQKYKNDITETQNNIYIKLQNSPRSESTGTTVAITTLCQFNKHQNLQTIFKNFL